MKPSCLSRIQSLIEPETGFSRVTCNSQLPEQGSQSPFTRVQSPMPVPVLVVGETRGSGRVRFRLPRITCSKPTSQPMGSPRAGPDGQIVQYSKFQGNFMFSRATEGQDPYTVVQPASSITRSPSPSTICTNPLPRLLRVA